MVKVRGRNSNGKTVKQTVKNGQNISGDDAARPAWVMVPGVSSSRLRPDSDQSRIWCPLDRDSGVTHWMSSPGSALWYTDIWQSFFFFFFFLSFCECCLTRQWQSTECDARYMVQQKKFDVILRLLVDRYRRTKPPKPDASQFVVPARLPKPVIGSGGLSSSRFDDDMPEVNCTWTASFSRRVKEAALWFESHGSKNLTGGTTWSSQSTSTDWLTRTHHWSSPRSLYLPTRSLQVPESYENFLCHLVKVRSIVTGLRQDDERDDDRSHRRVSTMSSLDAGWFRLITNILIQSRDLAMIARWHQCGTMTSQILARASFPPSVWPSSRSNFDLGPSPSDSTEKNSIISELMILECSFPLISCITVQVLDSCSSVWRALQTRAPRDGPTVSVITLYKSGRR